jgi:RimJ/RimL family protein N-acetyltransferase
VDQPPHIRLFQPTDADYAAIGAVGASFPPDMTYNFEFRSATEARVLDEAFVEAGRPLARYVAEANRKIVGYAYAFEIAWAAPAGRYWCVIRVAPEHQRKGIGTQLHDRQIADLTALGARSVQVETHESLSHLLVPLQRRGFRKLLRSWMFTLDTRQCDISRFASAYERLGGLTITTLAEEQVRDPGWLPKLYELHTALSRDIPIPGHPLPRPPLAWFAEHVAAMPEAFFIVRDGEQYVAESYLHASQDEPDVLAQIVTGVRSDYRGRGIALALKLETIAFAQRHGFSQIRTGVESNNPAMLAINARLGFVQAPGLILFEKQLGIEI